MENYNKNLDSACEKFRKILDHFKRTWQDWQNCLTKIHSELFKTQP